MFERLQIVCYKSASIFPRNKPTLKKKKYPEAIPEKTAQNERRVTAVTQILFLWR